MYCTLGRRQTSPKLSPSAPRTCLRCSTLLTGGPGRIGRYRLRDLTRRGHRVAVLIRERRDCPAAERITEVVAEIDEVTGVVTGDRALQLQDGEVLLPSFGPTAAATARRAAEQHHPTPNAA